jgi:polygalacturonase
MRNGLRWHFLIASAANPHQLYMESSKLGLMQFTRLCMAVSSLALAVSVTAQESPWDHLPDILAEIKEPAFPNRDFSITDYGAKADAQTDCKPAFDKAIAACVAAGGGRVVVPAGKWLTNGPLHLEQQSSSAPIRSIICPSCTHGSKAPR